MRLSTCPGGNEDFFEVPRHTNGSSASVIMDSLIDDEEDIELPDEDAHPQEEDSINDNDE